ncbi:UNC-50 family protein [Dunaliella salina]|uniref:UNC-50 family protein n=1 Tax=Dunaliella salina TaxID=3046 RepID=A0ABQ7H4J2_DUNSA|nr:UNC-50 family protein [Dunaliella salina]|eukprot:KAF5841766.1 UNC-50 family protein [Dunaliella salina]
MLPSHRTKPPSSSFRPGLSMYLRRIYKPRQLDIEYALWLMLQLCISPKTAYRHTAYHKQTKNQWARDDPAFVVVTCVLVMVAALAYCITFGDTLWHSLLTILSAVLVDYLLLGFAVATACWFIADRFLRKKPLSHQVEQHVEWLYAFDVHCNSYFPLFLLLYVLQFFLSPLLLWHSFLANSLSVALYAAALGYYHYMNFLGYSALPFLEHTEVFLWPIGLIMLCIPFMVLTGFNPARFTLSIYFG